MSSIERNVMRVLVSSALPYGLSLAANVQHCRDWASSLFVGECLTVETSVGALDDDRDVFDRWLAALPDLDLRFRGHFVADAEVTARGDRIATIEILVIEEG